MNFLNQDTTTLVETKYLIAPNCSGAELLRLAILELLFDGSLELKKEVKQTSSQSTLSQEFYVKKGMNFNTNHYHLYQKVIINSLKGLNGYLSIKNLCQQLHVRLEGSISDFTPNFVKQHINRQGWHGTTLFFHNYLSAKGKKMKNDIKPIIEHANKRLVILLRNKSEHAISIINNLDQHLLLIENISPASATIINQLIRDKHSNLSHNLNLKKIDLPLILQLKKTLEQEITHKNTTKVHTS